MARAFAGFGWTHWPASWGPWLSPVGLRPRQGYRRDLLDMNPDQALTARMRRAVEVDGDEVTDLHLGR